VRARRRAPPVIPALAAGATGALLALLSSNGLVGERAVFSSLTLLLLLYNGIEIGRVRRVHPDRWLLNPVVVASVLTFCLGFGFSNFLFFLPAESIRLVGLIPDVTPAMVKLMWLVLIAAIGMWLGYWSSLAAKISGPKAQRLVSRWFRNSDSPRKLALPTLVLVSLVARLAQIKLGVFGYSSSYDRLVELGSVTQYLAMGASLGSVALVVASLDLFSDRPRPSARLWFALVVVVEVVLGLLSGFKSAVAMPFVIVGVCKYLRSGRLPLVWVAWFVMAIVLAYAVIEPFRAQSNLDPSFQATSIVEILDNFVASGGQQEKHDAKAPLWLSMLARSSYGHIGSLGVSFRDERDELPEGSPKFMRNLLLAPAYAFVPRLIWPSKPLGNLGLWYTQVVIGLNHFSSTAMGPVTYLYFAGGALVVFMGFMGFGILHRILFFLARPDLGAPRALFYLGMLSSVSLINSAVDGAVVSIFRLLVLLLVLQLVVYRRRAVVR